MNELEPATQDDTIGGNDNSTEPSEDFANYEEETEELFL